MMGFTLARPFLVFLPSCAHGWHFLGGWGGAQVDGKGIPLPKGRERGSMAGTEDGVSVCGGCVIREPCGFLFVFRGFSSGSTGDGVEQTE